MGGSSPCRPLITSTNNPAAISPLNKLSLRVNVSQSQFSTEPSSNIVDGSDSRWLVYRNKVYQPFVELFIDRKRVLNRLRITPLKNVGATSIASLVSIEFDDASATYLQFDCTSNTQTFYLEKPTARFKMTILKTCDEVKNDYTGLTEVVAYEGGINSKLNIIQMHCSTNVDRYQYIST